MFLEHADAAEQEAGMQNVHIVIVSLIKEHFAMCTSHLLQQADASRCKQMQTDAKLPHVAFVLEAVEQAKELAARFALTWA